MKKILDMIFKLKENPFLGCLFVTTLWPIFLIIMFSIQVWIIIGIIFAPFVIIDVIFGIDMPYYIDIIIFIVHIFICIVCYNIKSDKITKLFYILGIFSGILCIFNMNHSSLPKKVTSSVPSSSYHARREYSPNYSYHDSHSNSSNRYSEPSDYISPPSIETEPLISQKDNEEHNNQGSSKLSDVFSEPSDINSGSKLSDIFSEPSDINSDEISPPPSETAIYERWEYVTSDYQGNDYYINKNFGVNIAITSIEGKVFYASFKKVLSNGGREVEVPVYDINRGEIMEKQILSYEESIIRFRNLNGVKEFSFYTMSGYTPDNFVIIGWGIVGWGIDNINSTYDWQPINNEVYDALYNAAYEKLK